MASPPVTALEANARSAYVLDSRSRRVAETLESRACTSTAESSRRSSRAGSSGRPPRRSRRGPPHATGAWPWATFVVNALGAFLLGYFVTRLQERLPLSAYRRPFLGTGFCGGLTTFSTMQVELLQMLDADRVGLAVVYAAGSVVIGFAGVAVASNLVRRSRLTA